MVECSLGLEKSKGKKGGKKFNEISKHGQEELAQQGNNWLKYMI